MQKIDITSSRELDPARSDWSFVEVWIDPMLSPPYILLLLGDPSGGCRVYDPAEGYKVVFSSATYDDAQTWLLEDEYEPVEGQTNKAVHCSLAISSKSRDRLLQDHLFFFHDG